MTLAWTAELANRVKLAQGGPLMPLTPVVLETHQIQIKLMFLQAGALSRARRRPVPRQRRGSGHQRQRQRAAERVQRRGHGVPHGQQPVRIRGEGEGGCRACNLLTLLEKCVTRTPLKRGLKGGLTTWERWWRWRRCDRDPLAAPWPSWLIRPAACVVYS